MPQIQPESAKQTFLVVDDHPVFSRGTASLLQQEYPEATIITAQTSQEALQKMEQVTPTLVVVDLAMPESKGKPPQANTGCQLLKVLMERYPNLNIMVHSGDIHPLIWLKLAIDNHMGGFTIVDKGQSEKDMLTMVDWTLCQRTYTPREIRNGLQLKPEWLEVLQLGCQGALEDKAIAKRMNVSERLVQHYWAKIRDVLEVYPEEGRNLRTQTCMAAIKTGLIDS